jgi:hypothetical protein
MHYPPHLAPFFLPPLILSFAESSSPSPSSAATMFGRKGKRRAVLSTKDCTSITEGLKKIYFHKVRPATAVFIPIDNK